MGNLSREEIKSCKALLKDCEMFTKLSDSHLEVVAKEMYRRQLNRKEVLQRQGEACSSFFILQEGTIDRKRLDPNDRKVHQVEFAIPAASINTMRILSGDVLHNTVRCTAKEGCTLYEMKRTDFLNLLLQRPDMTTAVAASLSDALRLGSKKYQTPLLEQKQQEINLPAVSIAAGIESYYRSALNAMLNARLTGSSIAQASFFPNMHIQVPTRITYIVGFKGLRTYLDRTVDADAYDARSGRFLVGLGTTIAPGILMTPISSVLEASNAGHMNPESMATRWMRGIAPRCGREIMFGLGLNQLSDYFEERIAPAFGPRRAVLANAAGSVLAGIVSGYLSHVPHNLSTYRLLEPHRGYRDLYRQFVDRSVPPAVEKFVVHWPPLRRAATRTVFATLFPRGLAIRTTQIVGSFMILNGTINYLQLREHLKIQRAISGAVAG
jgi:Cyclic nucleotide-binding domain